MKKQYLVTMIMVMMMFGIASCGGSATSGGGGEISGNLAGVTTDSSTASGDFTPSLTAAVNDDGTLKFTVTALDVDGDETLETPAISSITVTSGAPSFSG